MEEDLLTCDLPGDIMLEILSRQPVKTLVKFKCVNKAWYSLVKNQFFIQKHFNYWYKFRYGNFPIVGYDIKSNIGILEHESTKWEQTKIFLPGAVDLELVGAANGLICLTHKYSSKHFGRDILVINLALRKSKTISKELVRERKPEKYDFVSVGFGYSQKDGDFKLIRIEHPAENSMGRRSKIEIYSVYEDSWKKIKCSLNIKLWDYGGKHSGNSVYWISNDGKDITVFSLSSEKFSIIPLPAGSLRWYCVVIGACGFDSIVALIYDLDEEDMWTWTTCLTENNPGTYSFSWRRERYVSPKQYKLISEGRKTSSNIEFPDYDRYLRAKSWWDMRRGFVPCAHLFGYIESLVPVEQEVADGQKLYLKEDCDIVDVVDSSKVFAAAKLQGGYALVYMRRLLLSLIIDYIVPPP